MTYLAVDALAQASPSHWHWLPLRRVARLRRERNSAKAATLLALSSELGVVPRPDDGGRQLPSEGTIENYWLVRPGDLVFNPMWAIGRGVAVSDLAGAVSTAYRVYRPGPSLHPRFLHHYLRSDPVVDQYGLVVRGLTTFDRSVARDDLDGMPVPVPPLSEQEAIAEYLDTETARIDSVIRKKRRLIELLDERRQAIIDRMVADLTTVHTVGPIAGLCERVVDCVNKTAPTTDLVTGFKMIRTTNVRDGRVDLDNVFHVDEDVYRVWTRRGAPRVGDVILTREAPVGEVGVLRSDVQVFLGQRLMMYRPSTDTLSEYLAFVLRSTQVQDQIRLLAAGSLHEHLRVADCSRLAVPLPDASAQRAMVDEALAAEDQVVRVRDLIGAQLQVLSEHRQAMVTGAVSGALAIPGAAA